MPKNNSRHRKTDRRVAALRRIERSVEKHNATIASSAPQVEREDAMDRLGKALVTGQNTRRNLGEPQFSEAILDEDEIEV